MKLSFFRRIPDFVKNRILPSRNTAANKAEQFYFEEFIHFISPWFVKGQELLDVGCGMGRFTISASLNGMKVTATNIRAKSFRYISKQIAGRGNVEFRHETPEQSLNNLPPQKFDVILCLEMPHNVPELQQTIEKLSLLLKPGGVLFTSHRSPGYYLFRFIRENNFEAALRILNASHPDYAPQTTEELMEICRKSGLELLKLAPIGLFSDFESDPFLGIANPEKMSEDQKKALFTLETDPQVMRIFANSARYNLMISRRI